MTLENRLRSNGVKVEGTFNVRNVFDTLSKICSNKYGADIKIKSFSMKALEEPETEEINIA